MERTQTEQESIAKLKKILLTLSETKLNTFFMGAVLKCRTVEDSFLLSDLLKEICETNGYDINNVISYEIQQQLEAMRKESTDQ